MVNFKLSNELSLQQELYRKFAETELKPIAAEADETETFPMDVWMKVHLTPPGMENADIPDFCTKIFTVGSQFPQCVR